VHDLDGLRAVGTELAKAADLAAAADAETSG
jgi:hypothetical protein